MLIVFWRPTLPVAPLASATVAPPIAVTVAVVAVPMLKSGFSVPEPRLPLLTAVNESTGAFPVSMGVLVVWALGFEADTPVARFVPGATVAVPIPVTEGKFALSNAVPVAAGWEGPRDVLSLKRYRAVSEVPEATGIWYAGFEAVGKVPVPVPEGKCAVPTAVPAAAVPKTVVL